MKIQHSNHEKRILWFQDRLIPDKVRKYMVNRGKVVETIGYNSEVGASYTRGLQQELLDADAMSLCVHY